MSQVDLLPKPDSQTPTPRILFVPHMLAESLALSMENINTLFKFEEAVKALSLHDLGALIIANSLYNSTSNIFLKSELLEGFELVDMTDVYRDTVALSKCADVNEDYRTLIRHVESAKFKEPNFPDGYLRPIANVDNDMENANNNVQYYVPVLFALREGIYGVRLVAITDLQQEKQIIVANLELLSKSYPTNVIAKFDYFERCIEVC